MDSIILLFSHIEIRFFLSCCSLFHKSMEIGSCLEVVLMYSSWSQAVQCLWKASEYTGVSDSLILSGMHKLAAFSYIFMSFTFYVAETTCKYHAAILTRLWGSAGLQPVFCFSNALHSLPDTRILQEGNMDIQKLPEKSIRNSVTSKNMNFKCEFLIL